MNMKPTLYWSEKIVAGYIIQCASIHRRLPEVRVPGYHTLWPVTMKDEWERLYDMLNGKPTLGSPMPPEVSFSDAVLEWLQLLDRSQQQLVWMRANRVPWKILVEEFGRSKPTLWREHCACLSRIKYHLNRIDPWGEHYRQMRSRANCSAWCNETN